jgi:hypothetical protein
MDKLLKEAIADAKAVRETALANAKLALEEAFAPKLQSMLTAKINEEEDEMEDEEETTDEVMYEKEDAETEEEMDEAKGEGEEETEDEMDETLDLDSIIAELENEAKGEDEEAKEEEMDEAKDSDDDEEVDLAELLSVLEGEDEDESEEKMDEAKDEEEEKEKMDEIRRLRAELREYRQAVTFLKDKINEINLLNAKLLYTNKLFKNNSLTESQKVKILESLDRTKSVREVKLVYSTLAESLNELKGSTKKKITESLGFASKKSGSTNKTILEEGSTLASRFQTLANINVKKNK